LAQSRLADGPIQPVLLTQPDQIAPARWPVSIEVCGITYPSEIAKAIEGMDVLHLHAMDAWSSWFADSAVRNGIPFVLKIATQGDVAIFSDPNGSNVLSERMRQWGRPARHIAAATWGRYKAETFRTSWDRFRHASVFIALNGAIVKELESAGIEARRVLLMPNAVEIPEAPVQFRDAGAHAVCIARAEPRKRLGDLLAALTQVRAGFGHATLTVLTQDDGVEALARRARGMDGVEILSGAQSAASVLAGADLFLFPSEREGCPNALLEAAAAGLACVATAIPGVREWFRDEREALLYPPGDISALVRQWRRALEDSALRQQLGRQARTAVAQQAEAGLIAQQYRDLYVRLKAWARST